MLSWDRPVAKSTLIEVLSGYHAPKSGGGIRTQRADVPVKSTVTLLTARLSLPIVVGLASCHSREPSREEQTLRRPARILDRGSRRAALSKLRLESGPRALAAILDASARTRVAVPRWVEPRANSGSGDRGGVHAHSLSVSLTLAVERGHGSRIELPGD